MGTSIPFAVASATEIHRHESRVATKLSVSKFGPVAKLLWPFKTAAVLAAIASEGKTVPTTIRTAERWLSGEFEPPISVVNAVQAEIYRKQ